MAQHPRQMRGMKPSVKNPGKIFKRIMSYVFRKYKLHFMAVVVLIFIGVIANVQGTLFMQKLIDNYITPFLLSDTPNFTPLARAIGRVAVFYAVGVLSVYLYNRLMVYETQGNLKELSDDLFSHM